MKPVKTKVQTHKIALRRETIVVLAPRRLAEVVGGQHTDEQEGITNTYKGCLPDN